MSPLINVTKKARRLRFATTPIVIAAIIVVQRPIRPCFVGMVVSCQDNRLGKERGTLRQPDASFFSGVKPEPVLEKAEARC